LVTIRLVAVENFKIYEGPLCPDKY
jgi:hypothetical protein